MADNVKQAGRRLLSAMNVVECGWGVSAAYAAKLLADLGANVVKVEQPEGDIARRRGPFPNDTPDPERSGLFVYLNINKRGVVADLKKAEGRELLARLLERADIIIHNVPPAERDTYGLESSLLTASHPKLIVTSISMFGERGPRAHWRAHELTASNAGGWAYLSPGASPWPDLPPLKAFGQQCDFQGGVHAAMVTLAAYRHRLKSGQGQAIDVCEQETIAAILEGNFMHYTYASRETSRLGQRAVGPWSIMDCADGQIFIMCVQEDQWQRLVEFMGNPEWAGEELFKDRIVRGQNLDALTALMAEWVSQWKVQDLFMEGQRRRIPMAPVNTMRQISEDQHLRERDFFVEFDQPAMGPLKLAGPPSKYGKTRWALERPAPRLGEHGEEIFCGELGVDRARYAELKRAGIV